MFDVATIHIPVIQPSPMIINYLAKILEANFLNVNFLFVVMTTEEMA